NNSPIDLPLEIYVSEDGHRLVTGIESRSGIYDFSTIKRIDLIFKEDNWQQELYNNRRSERLLEAELVYDGKRLASEVGVKYKGFTSFMQNGTEKKSFKIKIDSKDSKQELEGYSTLNLNCAFSDNSFMREVLYGHNNRYYILVAAVNYVELYINGAYWGIYINSQQLDNQWTNEWFLSKKGTRWRAEPTMGLGGFPPPPGFSEAGFFPENNRIREKGFSGEEFMPDKHRMAERNFSEYRVSPDSNRMRERRFPEGGFMPDSNRMAERNLPEHGFFPDSKRIRERGFPEGELMSDNNGMIGREFMPGEEQMPGRGFSGSGFGFQDGEMTGGGMMMGGGASAMKYLGEDVENYKRNYDLKKSYKENPWEDLIYTCKLLDSLSGEELAEKIKDVLDVDRTLWFLACENIYQDEDSYVFKGSTDYYLYWEPETGHITPIEYDGNETFPTRRNGQWSPFFNADNENLPLLNKLLNVPSLRQRYLAHYRTILKERFNPEYMEKMIDEYAAKIDSYIQNDPKKMMTYEEFKGETEALKEYVRKRYDYLSKHEEINREGLIISDTKWIVNNKDFGIPVENSHITVNTRVSGKNVKAVNLYYALGVVGNFTKFEMFDDGVHEDQAANDGIYGLLLKAAEKGTRVRFYIEAIMDDEANTRTYFPAGAEHDVMSWVVE
ncbi:MAG: CotH kinase family protein, partial [Odoribacter sp.]|nr:CotH kinase family protein [Odoribacter sp.]